MALALAAPWAITAPAAAAIPAKPSTGELSARLHQLAGRDLRAATDAEQAEAVSLPARGPASLVRAGGALVVEVRLASRTQDRLDQLEAAGAEILHVSPEYRTVTAAIPEGSLKPLAAVGGVEAVTEVLAPMVSAAGAGDSQTAAISTCAGSVTSEADQQLKAAAARAQFNVDGSQIKVGVLSDSYDTRPTGRSAAEDVASADLPGPGNPCARTTPVEVVDDSQAAGSDEGRAMMQLVHDVAPGSPLAFATATTGASIFADNIRKLAAGGAEVIVDDVLYFDEPMFQDGPIAVTVSEVSAQGVNYYSSAGNSNVIRGGRDVGSWETPAYRLSASCPTTPLPYLNECLDFNPDPSAPGGDDNTYAITVPSGRSITLDLQWAQPWNGVTTDIDAYLIDGAGNIVAASEDPNLVTQKPFELLDYQNTTGASRNLELVINRYTEPDGGDSGSPRLKFVFLSGQEAGPTEYTSSAGGDIVGPTIFGHNGSGDAFSTAAVPFNNGSAPEAFSSRGPVTLYFGPVVGSAPAAPLSGPQVLSKPDIAATDGALTTFFGGGNRFFGTSAAAPHAAAVAALQLDANPAQSVGAVKAAQRSTADPVGGFGPFAVGGGLVDALGAVAANPPPPPTVTIASPGPTADSTPSLDFTTEGDLRSVGCALDGGAEQPCSSPFTVATPLADGAHTLSVRATDYFDQEGVAGAAFTVDTTGPAVSIEKRPKKRSKKRRARFEFASEPGAGFTCTLDARASVPCTSPLSFKVSRKRHRFAIQATDALGNVGPATSYGWKVKKRTRRR
jgi:hypothetical protein